MNIHAQCAIEGKASCTNERPIGLCDPGPAGLAKGRLIEHSINNRTDFENCWIWPADSAQTPDGYGLCSINGVKGVYAHRHAYKLATGEDAGELCVMHVVCDNPRCFNPAHLLSGSHEDNMRDMVAKGRHKSGAGKTKPRCTADEVRNIRKLKAEGNTRKKIAEITLRSEKTITSILRGRTHTNVS